jgi:predicted AAA+ superfamily ATPase
VVSVSSSISILTGGAESLVGRILPRVVLPMKFAEAATFRRTEINLEKRLNDASVSLRTALKAAIESNNAENFYSALRNNANLLAEKRKQH